MSYINTEGLSGAEYLASIYGTEKDKVNCSFYFKVFFMFRAIHAGRKVELDYLDWRMPTWGQMLPNASPTPILSVNRPEELLP